MHMLDKQLSRAPLDCLKSIAPDYALVQDFYPLSQSLATKIAAAHWQRCGTSAFGEEQVPFAVTSDGYLSTCAAGVLYTHCEELPPTAAIKVLELGAGSGLFARYFLDVFRDICRREGRDYYDRLSYVVTDGSEATVQHWIKAAIFSGHEDQIQLAICDARGGEAKLIDGTVIELHDLRTVFANYVLDILPMDVLRRSVTGAIEHKCSRVWINLKSAAWNRQTMLGEATIEAEIRALMDDGSPPAQQRLENLLPDLSIETDFLACRLPSVYADMALGLTSTGENACCNHGAFDALSFWRGRLHSGGFILLADYGNLGVDTYESAGLDSFGPTVASGLNFPLLDLVVSAAGWAAHAPPGDSTLPIHPRLIAACELPQTVASFNELYNGSRYLEIEGQIEQARIAVHEWRLDEAAQYFQLAVASRQTDWRLLGEVADFTLFHLKKPQLALELAHAALALNSWYSAPLWNVYGDALFAERRWVDAHQAYLTAESINPSDLRAKLGLIYTLSEKGDFGRALTTVALALTLDSDGAYRERLLSKQRDVLRDASEAARPVRAPQRISGLLRP